MGSRRVPRSVIYKVLLQAQSKSEIICRTHATLSVMWLRVHVTAAQREHGRIHGPGQTAAGQGDPRYSQT
jgi:hypothetical protein